MGSVKCEFCDSLINDQLEKCPNCGAPNTNMRRTVNDTPKTIAQLQQWYKDRNLPPAETTRFFIGIDYKHPKAFGIYQEGNRFIVYKNKDNGQRAIRYEGTDEAYAVNELYMRLKSEIINQKELNQNKRNSASNNNGQHRPISQKPKKKDPINWIIMLTIILVIGVGVTVGLIDDANTGYYAVDDTAYYYDGGIGSWYYFDDYDDDWYRCSEPVTSGSVWDYKDESFESEWTGPAVTDSEDYSSDYEEYQSSSDSDSDWSSSDSWDSGGSDWGSDW